MRKELSLEELIPAEIDLNKRKNLMKIMAEHPKIYENVKEEAKTKLNDKEWCKKYGFVSLEVYGLDSNIAKIMYGLFLQKKVIKY